ncbi:DUF4352 domain-containing protein [Streptomyces griseorubiginosus]|uniref:DUF4352 domain-containing protein n=1 Tax=Streptomyces griseorubiginosus TaxID=67304 RepID=UPI0033320423
MRTRTALAAITAVAALTISACDSGTTVTDKPNTATPKAASSSKPAAEPSTAAPAPAGVGDTITLKGSEEGSQLDVTVVKVADPARSSDEYTSPEDGNRWVGVQFRLLNSGSKAYGDSPANGAQIYDKDGQQFGPVFADITAGPSMSSEVKLKPGAKALGWITFEVPKGVKAATVQFAMNSGFADQTGEWKLS